MCLQYRRVTVNGEDGGTGIWDKSCFLTVKLEV
jgi:hypothetical protein